MEPEVVTLKLAYSAGARVVQVSGLVYEDTDGQPAPLGSIVGYLMPVMAGSLEDLVLSPGSSAGMFMMSLLHKCATAVSSFNDAEYVHLDVKLANFLYWVDGACDVQVVVSDRAKRVYIIATAGSFSYNSATLRPLAEGDCEARPCCLGHKLSASSNFGPIGLLVAAWQPPKGGLACI